MWKKWKKKLSSLLILTLIVSMIAPDLSVIASSADVIIGSNGTVYDANYEPDIIDEDAEYYDEDDEEYEDYCEDYEVDSVYALASDSNASPSNATRATGSNATRATSSNAGRLASGSNWDPERCAICGTKNCTTAHLYCTEHGEFDCMESHTPVETEKPITEAIIPENPTLTDGADVSIVDAEGEAVTEETGFVIPEGTRVSLSAFLNDSTISADSYQWQICYDTENDLWTDIQGQDNQGMIISLDLMNSISDPTIRCEVVSDEETLYSEAIPIIVEEVTEEESGEAIAMFRFARAASNVEAEEETVAAAAETGEQTTDTYSIVINYVFENREVVADPYTATFGAGTSYKATVTHPTVMGYLPYVGNDAETSTRIDLNIENMQEDVTYTVTYKPTNVDYTVIHYLQNVHNDNYTIEETVTTQGLTASTVPEVAKTYEGFYALLYEKPEIAADGSTVVEVYYDRYYYLMNFDLDGGYGVEPIYARYGAPVSVGTPTKAGYEFLGWSLDGTNIDDLPETIPAEEKTYKAVWKANENATVKVVFWGENPNDEEYSYITTGTVTAQSGTEYTFDENDNTVFLICGKEEHTHSEDCNLICGKDEHTGHTDECLSCDHTHTLDCYSAGNYGLIETTKPDEITSYPTNGIYSYKTRGLFGQEVNHYYLYINGVWYRAGNSYVGDIIPITLSCSHTHTDACYSCEIHEHTAECYSCGLEEHTHDPSCNQTGSGLDSTLWTFKESETKTVAADGSTVINVYYDRVSYNVEFHNNQDCTNEYTNLRITAKWGENILSKWPTYNGSSSWLVEGESNTWQNSIQVMPVGGAKFWGPKGGSGSYKAYYYVEALPGASDTIVHNGVTYILHHYDTSVSSGNVTIEEQYAIEGFTYKEGTEIGDSYNNAKFYYSRHKYNIEFYNPTTLLKTETDVPYQASLTSYVWTPDSSQAPVQYEPGSVEFEGWYLNPECTGNKFDFTSHTMPAGTNDGDTTLTLYAKWVPVTYTVSFYLDKNAMDAGTEIGDTHPDLTVSHGEKVETVPTTPTNGNYTFVGWFYMDGNTEKAFDFANMPVTKNMQVYGKWSSNTLKEYYVYFRIKDTNTDVAEPITGSALAGSTKTFDAKGDTDLYTDYQDGYFPLVQSHSLTLDIENDTNNTFTFWYEQKDAVPYIVYYVAETLKDGGTSLGTIERNGTTYYIIAGTYTNSENRKAVVTEKFETVAGYMPDAYQKRLVVTTGGTDADKNGVEDQNEIIFYYTVDNKHAYYKVTHYTQSTDGVTWTEYDSDDYMGEIGATVTAKPITIDGFTYDPDVAGTLTSGIVTADGLELKLYYTRNRYPYEVRYLEQGSGKSLADPETGRGLYGDVISKGAIDITNYTAVDPTSQTLTIKIETGGTAKVNIITFYYTENQATINYEAIGPEGVTFGTVSPVSETLKVLTGTALGSTAEAADNYKFVGWYSDEACTTLISTDAKYIPEKAEGVVWVDGTTYYAKFELDVADLTITKTGTISPYDEHQSFIFHVTGPNDFSLDVVINGTGSATIKDLPVGTYVVKEITDWSWRYDPDEGEQDITLKAGKNIVTFVNTREKNHWLSGDSVNENQFTVKSKEEEN